MVSAFETVVTRNARIRIARTSDAAFIAAIENDAELKRFIGGVSGKSEECYFAVLQTVSDLRFLVVESPSEIPIGLCGLLTGPMSIDCEIRVILQKEYWGRGLGTEIATALKAVAAEAYHGKQVTAKVHPDNIASRTIAPKLGLTEAGTILGGHYHEWIEFCTPSNAGAI
jgi:RimJ/RimL family protein N-acetyltransferase